MYDLHRCLDTQLRALHKPRPTLIMPEANDCRTVEAAERLTRVANIVLLTTEAELHQLVQSSGLDRRIRGTVDRLLRKVCCVDVSQQEELREEFARAYVELGQGKKWGVDLDRARQVVRDPVYFCRPGHQVGLCGHGGGRADPCFARFLRALSPAVGAAGDGL